MTFYIHNNDDMFKFGIKVGKKRILKGIQKFQHAFREEEAFRIECLEKEEIIHILFIDYVDAYKLNAFLKIKDFKEINEIHFGINLNLTNEHIESMGSNSSFRNLKKIFITNMNKDINILKLQCLAEFVYIEEKFSYRKIIQLYKNHISF